MGEWIVGLMRMNVSHDTDPPAKPLTISQQQQQARKAKRQSRYDEVKQLYEQGVSQRAIAALVGLHRETVHR